MIKALVFDFDGLIVDTEMSSYQTWQEIYAEHDCQLPFSTWAICIGGSPQLFDPCEYLEQQIGRPVLREEIRLRRRQQHIRMVEAQPVLPGVEDYILSAKRLGLKIGVASSSRHEWVDTHLTRLGLIDEYQLTTVPIAIGAGRSPFAELGEHLKLDVVYEERFKSGALAQILVPRQ